MTKARAKTEEVLRRFAAWKEEAAKYAQEINLITTGDLFTEEDLYDVKEDARNAFDAGTSPRTFIDDAFAEDIAEQDMYDDAVDQGWGAEELDGD